MTISDIIAGLHIRGLLTLVDDICKLRGVTIDELCGQGRSRAISHARQEVWWHIRHHPDRQYSYPEIARLFGRDHTTVMAGIHAHVCRTPAPPP